MPPRNTKPDMPQDSWPITKDDKAEMRELGAKLNDFLHGYFKDRDRVHIKIVIGAFQYITDLQMQKSKLIGDDFALADKVIVQNKLTELIETPFQDAPEEQPPTIEERRKYLQDQLEALAKEEEVLDASPAPSESPEIKAYPEQPDTPVPAADGPSNS